MTTYPSFLRRLGLRRAIMYGDYCRFAEVRLIAEALRGSNPRRVLDIGSSGTVFPHYLAALFPEAQIVGIDNEANVQLEAERITTETGTLGVGERVTLFTGDARQMAFPNASFDAITCVSTIEHIPEDGDMEALAEFARVLRPGGLVAMTLPMWEVYIELPKTAATPYFERKYTGPVLRERLLSNPDFEVIAVRDFNQRWLPYSEWYLRMKRRLNALWHTPGLGAKLQRHLMWLGLMPTPLMSRIFIHDWAGETDEDHEKSGGACVVLRRR